MSHFSCPKQYYSPSFYLVWLTLHSPGLGRKAVVVKSSESYPTLWDPMDCSLPGSSVHGISQQEYWSGLPFPSPGNLPDPGVKTSSLASPALAGRFFTTAPPTGFRGTQTLNPYKGERMNKQDCAMLCLKVAHIRRGSTIQGKEHPNVCVCQVASVMSDSL